MNDPKVPVKKIGLMGGSFDPLHIGHLIIAQDAVEHFELSELKFIPAAIPPHKQDREQVSAFDRFKMVEAVVAGNPKFSVSDVELNRGGVSYTVDSVRAMTTAFPDVQFMLIIGSDTLVDLHNWHQIDEVLKLCDVASFLRPGESSLEEIRQKVLLDEPARDKLLKNTFSAHLIDISSTEIRERVCSGRSIRHLVPAEVEQYIFENGLYKG